MTKEVRTVNSGGRIKRLSVRGIPERRGRVAQWCSYGSARLAEAVSWAPPRDISGQQEKRKSE